MTNQEEEAAEAGVCMAADCNYDGPFDPVNGKLVCPRCGWPNRKEEDA